MLYEVITLYVPASSFGGPEGTYNKISLSMKQNTSATFQTTLNVFNQSVFVGLKSAKMAQKASLLSEQMTEETIVYEVMSTYYSVQVYQDNLDRLNDNITNLEKTVEINDVLRKNELVSDNVHQRMFRITSYNVCYTKLLRYCCNCSVCSSLSFRKFSRFTNIL